MRPRALALLAGVVLLAIGCAKEGADYPDQWMAHAREFAQLKASTPPLADKKARADEFVALAAKFDELAERAESKTSPPPMKRLKSLTDGLYRIYGRVYKEWGDALKQGKSEVIVDAEAGVLNDTLGQAGALLEEIRRTNVTRDPDLIRTLTQPPVE